MKATPLPPLGNLFQGEEAVRAYERIIPLENENPVLIRILGWMLIHAPNEDGRAYVARSINRCLNDPEIIEAGRYHFQYFVKYFQTVANKPTLATSEHPSQPSIDTLRDTILNSVDQAPTNHSQAKSRALVRDNYRCQLTGRFDCAAYLKSPVLRAQVDAIPGASASVTECHHILPEYIGQYIADNEPKCMNAATVCSVVNAYGGIPPQEVNGAGIHNLGNIMTLRVDILTSFDSLHMWLEPLEGPGNTYSVGRTVPRLNTEVPPIITLATDTGLPLPDHRYLALHAACAKVIHMSGAAELIDSILRDTEDAQVLAQDGSSAGLFDSLLYGHTAA
ncbi:hypothetical protein RSAG8_13061, partial [Rhizoctonia solani AG-8 WAC10335]